MTPFQLEARDNAARSIGPRMSICPSGVVDVVLAGHVPTGEGEEGRRAKRRRRRAPVADMEQSGAGLAGQFDLNLCVPARGRGSHNRRRRQDSLHSCRLGPRFQAEVDESGTGDLRCLDEGEAAAH